MQPSGQPTSRPSRQPTSQPSGQPSGQPVTEPTGMPTTSNPTTSSPLPEGVTRTPRPTYLPTSMPTVAPSSRPTSQPTLSIEGSWNADLATTLSSFVPTTNSLSQVSFSEIVHAGSLLKSIGGLTSWKTFLKGSLLSAASSMSTYSIYFVHQDDLTTVASNTSCTNSTAAALMVNTLTSLVSPVDNLTLTCGGAEWKISACPSFGQEVALCVGCADPCPGSIDGFNQTVDPALDFPNACDGSGALCHHSLIVDFQVPHPPATVTTLQPYSDSTHSVVVNVTTSEPASVFCAPFPEGNTPTALEEITKEKWVNTTSDSSYNTTLVTISDLYPATNYSIYCTTMSLSGTYLKIADVLLQSASVYTSCCKSITLEQQTATTYSGTNYNDLLKLTIEALPLYETTLTFSIYKFDAGSSGSYSNDGTVEFQYNQLVIDSTTSLSSATYLTLLSNTTRSSDAYYTIIMNEEKTDRETKYNWDIFQPREYTLVMPYGNLKLMGSTSVPSAPAVYSTQYTYTGAYVAITFDMATNRAGLSGYFTCSNLLSFTGMATASCYWIDAFTLAIEPSATGTRLAIGGTITLSPISSSLTIKAECDTAKFTTTQCATFPALAADTSTTVAVSSNAIIPTVDINMPSSVGSCRAAVMDLSASTGAAGQAWSSVSLSVQSSSAINSTKLEIYLNQQQTRLLSGEQVFVKIASSYLSSGSYQFTVELCNWLGKCGSTLHSMTVLSTLLPSVTIGGSLIRTMTRAQILSLSAKSFMPTCDGTAESGRNLTLVWEVYQNDVLQVNSKYNSVARSPYRFKLNGYTLDASKTYEIRATASNSYTGTSSTSSVEVIVTSNELVAVIDGAAHRTIKRGEKLEIDASLSYDADLPVADRDNDATLEYTWSCATLIPKPLKSCAVSFENATMVRDRESRFDDDYKALPQPVYRGVPTYLLTAGTVIRVSVLVKKGTRQSTRSVTLEVVDAKSAVVDITALTLDKQDVTKKISLSGVVVTSYRTQITWSSNDTTGITMSEVASSSLTKTVAAPTSGVANVTSNFVLVITAGALQPDTSYTFKLSSVLLDEDSSLTPSSASITVLTNGPPKPGSLKVQPDTGTELSTEFTLSMINWIDTDLPLLYQFAFLSPTNNELIQIGGLSEVAYYSKILPAGGSNGSALTCYGYVYDSYLAKSSGSYSITVNEAAAASVTADNLATTFSDLLSTASGEPDETKSALAVTTSVLNRVDCSSTPPATCAALNRDICSSVDNSCGACLTGYISGDYDYGMSKCVSTASALSASNSRRKRKLLLNRAQRQEPQQAYQEYMNQGQWDSVLPPTTYNNNDNDDMKRELASTVGNECSSDSDCTGTWEECTNSICVIPSKACGNSCNNQGSCVYLNKYTKLKESACLVSDPECTPVCICTSGYGPTCGLSEAESNSRANLRDSMITQLETVIASDDASVSILTWISLLSAITSDVYDLARSSTATNRAMRLAQSILTAASALDSDNRLTSAEASTLLSSLDALITAQAEEVRANDVVPTKRDRGFGVVSSRRRRLYLADYDSDENTRTSDHGYDIGRKTVSSRKIVNDTQAASNIEDLLTLISSSYVSLVSSDLADGEYAVQSILNNVRLSIQRQSADGEASGTLTIASTTAESLSSGNKSSVLAPAVTSSSSSGTSMTLTLMEQSSATFGNTSLLGNAITLDIASLPNDAVADGNFNFTIENVYDVDTEHYARTYNIPCYNRRPVTHNLGCIGGFPNVTHTCNGSAYTATLICPSFYHTSVCQSIDTDTGTYSASSCTVVAFDEYTTTCSCPLATITARRRNRRLLSWEAAEQNNYDGDEDYLPSTYDQHRQLSTSDKSFSISSSSQLVTSYFTDYNTLTAWPDPEANDYTLVITVSVLIAITVVLVVYGTWSDFYMWDIRKSNTQIMKMKQDFSIWDVVHHREEKISEKDAGMTSAMAALALVRARMEEERERMEALARAEQEIPPMRKVIKMCIPSIYSTDYFYGRVWEEFLLHHRWLGLIFHYDRRMSRFTRTILVLLHGSVFMFVCAIFTYIFFYDDGYCYKQYDAASCEARPSLFSVDVNYCEYDAFENTCYLKVPHNNTVSILFVIMLSYLACIPLFNTLDWIIRQLIRIDHTRSSLKDIEDEAHEEELQNALAEDRRNRKRNQSSNDISSEVRGRERRSVVGRSKAEGSLSQEDNEDLKSNNIGNAFASRFHSSYKRMTEALKTVDPFTYFSGSKKIDVDPDAVTPGTAKQKQILTNRGTQKISAEKMAVAVQKLEEAKKKRAATVAEAEEGEGEKTLWQRYFGWVVGSGSKSGLNYFGEQQRLLEERVLKTSLDEDIRRWTDAVSLYKTMIQLGLQTDEIVNRVLYGPHFATYLEQYEAKLVADKKRYKLYKKGKYHLPKISIPPLNIMEKWNKVREMSKQLNCFKGNTVQPEGANDDHSDVEVGEEEVASDPEHATPSPSSRKKASIVPMAPTTPVSPEGEGPVSISQALQFSKDVRKQLQAKERADKIIEDHTLRFFKQQRVEATNDILRLRNKLPIDRALRMFFRLHMDLVDKRTESIATAKMERDQHVTDELTPSAWIFVYTVILAFVASTIAFGTFMIDRFDNHYQYFWCYCCLGWLVMEPIFINPMQIVVTHITIPLLVKNQLYTARAFIVNHIQSFMVQSNRRHNRKAQSKKNKRVGNMAKKKHSIATGKDRRKGSVSSRQKLNVVPYTFVSYRLALEFQSMRESQAIRSINTSTSQLQLQPTMLEKKSTFAILDQLFDRFIDLPIHIQDVIVYILSTFITSLLAILIARIYAVHYSIAPSIILGCALLYMGIVLFKYGRDRRKIRDLDSINNDTAIDEAITTQPSASGDDNTNVTAPKHDIFGNILDAAGHEVVKDNAIHSKLDDEEVEIFDLATNQNVSQECVMRLSSRRPDDRGILEEISAFVKKEDMDDEVFRDLPYYEMDEEDIQKHMFAAETPSEHAASASDHLNFMKEIQAKNKMEESHQVFESTVEGLKKSEKMPSKRAMKMMFESAMSALDAGDEQLARQRMNRSYEAITKSKRHWNPHGANLSPESPLRNRDVGGGVHKLHQIRMSTTHTRMAMPSINESSKASFQTLDLSHRNRNTIINDGLTASNLNSSISPDNGRNGHDSDSASDASTSSRSSRRRRVVRRQTERQDYSNNSSDTEDNISFRSPEKVSSMVDPDTEGKVNYGKEKMAPLPIDSPSIGSGSGSPIRLHESRIHESSPHSFRSYMEAKKNGKVGTASDAIAALPSLKHHRRVVHRRGFDFASDKEASDVDDTM